MRDGKLHPQQAQLTRRLLLEGGLMDVYRTIWPLIETQEFRENWHHHLLSEYLEEVERSPTGKDVIFNVPPGTGKTTLVNVAFPIYCWLKDPTKRLIVASFDISLALRDARRHAMVMESDMWKQCCADVCQIPRTYADSEIVNDKGGWRYSTSIPGGRVTGRHGDIHVYDDPVKPQDVTKLAQQNANEWQGFTAATRFQDINKRKRVLIMQRLHEADPSGFLEEQGFEVVRLPMRYERAYSHPRDPRTQDGELLWPEFKTEQAVQSLERDLRPSGTASQLQQRPTPEGGGIFKKDWLKFWHPEGQAPQDVKMYPNATRVALPKKFSRIIQSWDMAFLDLEGSDWVVGQVWGVHDTGLYQLDQVRDHWDAPATAVQVLKLSEKWPRARVKLVEKKANGPAVISMLRKRLTGQIAVEPDGGKVARANASSALFEAGDVYLPDPTQCAWMQGYLYEMFIFPNGKHDDQVDSTSQALNYLDKRKVRGKSLADRVLKEGWRL